MIYVTRIYTRQDINTPWYEPSSDYKTHLQENYINSGLSPKVIAEESNDGLTLIAVAVFKDQEAMDAFSDDPLCRSHMSIRKWYCEDNNISVSSPAILEK